MSTATPAIVTEALTKRYGDVVGIADLDLEVEPARFSASSGRTGRASRRRSGSCSGCCRRAGTARVLGAAVTDEAALVGAKRRLGYLPSTPGFDEGATGRRIPDLHGAIRGDGRRGELLELFDPPLDRKVRAYSSGNR